jgi:hypothetical protein
MAKKAYVYSGTDWVPLASEVTDLTPYQTIANSQAPFRNLVINGAMQVAQRGTSTASITTAGYYTADRWKTVITTQGTWTQTVENDAPTGSGFAKSVKTLCTTADASPASGDLIRFETSLEGQDCQRIRQGTSEAQQLTLQFWVKGNVTGTYIIELRNLDASRSISKSYTIDASGTWEKKTITFPADTTGTFDNDNNQSLVLHFYLGAGSDLTSGTLNTAWGSRVAANVAVGQTNLASAINNYWQITGVQLEVGAVATLFEFKPYAQDLRECQRYFQKSFADNTYGGTATSVGMRTGYSQSTSFAAAFSGVFATNMRAAPTITLYDSLGNTGKITSINDGTHDAAAIVDPTENGYYYINGSGSLTANQFYRWNFYASAEL